VEGVIRTTNGYVLSVRRERLIYNRTARREQCDYCYEILHEDKPLIRLETDRNPRYPAHAHIYRTELPGSETHHFEEHRWPERLRRPDFLKVYSLFQEIVAAGGTLPEPFGDGCETV
jgi:hypothetical protein